MKTTVVTKGGVQGAGANKAENKNNATTENRPNIPGKEKHNEPAKDQKPAETAEAKDVKATPATPVPAPAENHEPANPAEQGHEVKQEAPKGEVKYIKPVWNLEQTLKSVDGLHRLSVQRLALIARMKTLEAFEVKLVEEADELNDNPYQGCRLIIEDDKKRQFVTATPGLIRMVAQFIFDACNDKLTEIEANIVFPNA